MERCKDFSRIFQCGNSGREIALLNGYSYIIIPIILQYNSIFERSSITCVLETFLLGGILTA